MISILKKPLLWIIVAAVTACSAVGGLVYFLLNRESEPPLPFDVVINADSDYSIIYGATSPNGGKFAYVLKNKFKEACGTYEMLSDTSEETKYEILMGETNRPLSARLKAEAHKNAAEDSHVWGYAYEDGKLAIYASNAQDALDKAMEGFFNSYYKDGSFCFKPDLFEVFEYTKAQQEADIKAEMERKEAEERAERAEKAEEYKLLISAFSNLQFGSVTEDLGDDYAMPLASPTTGQHPRLLINSELLAELKNVMLGEECSRAYSAFLDLAKTETDGKLPPATVHETGRKGEHNYDNKLLAIIQAKALTYLLTGEEYYGYGAILAMKNFLLTLDIKWIHSDQCREFGYAMYNTALVYDWCYPLLTENDKHQLIAGVENFLCRGTTENTVDSTYGGVKMEIGFPPSKENAINGHGTEMQLLRDYLSFSVAIYDEYPSWWNYIGGRFYEEFVPVRNVFYRSSAYPQGTATYAPWRHMGDLWASWIVVSFGGDVPYEGDPASVVRTLFAHETYSNGIFRTGDGNNFKLSATVGGCALIASAIYNDSSLRAWAKHLGSGFSSFSYGVANITPAEMLVLSAFGTETAENRYEGFDTVYYNPYFLGQVISRQSYNDYESAVVLMKIGERSTANHDHQASGVFQIYYKGLLSGDGGVYDVYGSEHHYYYHQATISHNGLLIYNPALASSNKGWYSGGQKIAGNVQGLTNWESGKFETGEVTGFSSGYAEDKVTPTYAYLAGDITASYDKSTVDYVGRRMLTVYTNDPEHPMIMVVYDSIESDDPSFKKTFLLQVPTEPTVNGDRVTVVASDGKLDLVSLIGAENIEAIGGEDGKYNINGKECTPTKTLDNDNWGRVEISHSGEKKSEFLNFIYVSDADSTVDIVPQLIQSDDEVSGACGGGICAVFIKSRDRSDESITFTSSGSGNIRYYISGVEAGKWNVSINGKQPFAQEADEEGGFLSFEGEAGVVSLSSHSSDVPDNTYEIIYYLDGGAVNNAPYYYTKGSVTVLPTPTKADAIFEGWFLESDFENQITEISSTAEGKVRVYAKWKNIYTVDFSKSNLNNTGESFDYGTVRIQLAGKAGASVKTETVGGKTFLTWTKGDNDPSFSDCTNLADLLAGESKVTFRITLAKGKTTTFGTNFRLRGHDVGSLLSMHNTVSVFRTDDYGNVYLGSKGGVFLTLTEELTEFSVTVDFETQTLTAYNGLGNILSTAAFEPSSKANVQNAMEWKNQLTGFAYNWYGGTSKNSESDSVLRIGEITYYIGDYIAE